jgi:hypothetical protein
MDQRELELKHLEETEEHIILAERHIARQRERIAELEDEGLDAAAALARDLLETMLETYRLHLNNLDILRAELGIERGEGTQETAGPLP